MNLLPEEIGFNIITYGGNIPNPPCEYIVREILNVNPYINLNKELIIVEMLHRTRDIIHFVEETMRERGVDSKSLYEYMTEMDLRGELDGIFGDDHRYCRRELLRKDLDILTMYGRGQLNKVMDSGAFGLHPLFRRLRSLPPCSFNQSVQALKQILALNPQYDIGSLIQRCNRSISDLDPELVHVMNTFNIHSVGIMCMQEQDSPTVIHKIVLGHTTEILPDDVIAQIIPEYEGVERGSGTTFVLISTVSDKIKTSVDKMREVCASMISYVTSP